jgi:5,10-methylenetetrahydromethanopterin reductase
MRQIELGTWGSTRPGAGAESARAAEQAGYDVVLFPDSQNFISDPYVQLALAAKATRRVRLGTGVTNPLTRHAAVTATSILSIHAESGGRAILGIGRGDSAVRQVGYQPAALGAYGEYCRALQAYLSGKEVDQRGTPSRLAWPERVDLRLPKVPLDMACSGAKSIALAASVAERVTFAVGASPERIEWALAVARKAVAASGRRPEDVQYGAWLNVAVDADQRAAREAIRGVASIFAHFSAGTGTDFASQPEFLRRTSETLARVHDPAQHGRPDSPQARALTDEFIDWFAVAGPPGYVTDRLGALIKLGLTHLYLTGANEAFADRKSVV